MPDTLFDLCLSVESMLVLEWAILHEFEFLWCIAAILLCSIVLLLALCALKGNLFYWAFLL